MENMHNVKTMTIINLDKKVNTTVVEFLVNLSPKTSNLSDCMTRNSKIFPVTLTDIQKLINNP